MLATSLKLVPAILLLAACSSPAVVTQRSPATPQGEWHAEDIGGASIANGVETTLAIAADGAVSGSGGCNGYGGTAEITGSAIAFGPLATTRMACPPAQMDQETKFFEALEKAASWKIEDGKLLLIDGGGNAVVRLRPVADAAMQ